MYWLHSDVLTFGRMWENSASTLRNALRDTWYSLRRRLFIIYSLSLLLAFTIYFLFYCSEAFGSNEPTFVESYNCTGCRFIHRNASYNFTSACIAVVLTLSLIICFWKLFNFACFVKLLCFLFQLLSASVNPRNIIFFAWCGDWVCHLCAM